jgi:hypothetical protein
VLTDLALPDRAGGSVGLVGVLAVPDGRRIDKFFREHLAAD